MKLINSDKPEKVDNDPEGMNVISAYAMNEKGIRDLHSIMENTLQRELGAVLSPIDFDTLLLKREDNEIILHFSKSI